MRRSATRCGNLTFVQQAALHHEVEYHAVIAPTSGNVLERVVGKGVADDVRAQVGVLGHETARHVLGQLRGCQGLLIGRPNEFLALRASRRGEAVGGGKTFTVA